MKDEIQQERTWAVQRFLNGEKPESICASLCRSKAWLYKWVERHIADDNSWSESQSGFRDVHQNISQQYFENKFLLLFVTIQESLSRYSSKNGLRMLL